jgi:hypothetical protein
MYSVWHGGQSLCEIQGSQRIVVLSIMYLVTKIEFPVNVINSIYHFVINDFIRNRINFLTGFSIVEDLVLREIFVFVVQIVFSDFLSVYRMHL